MHPWMRWGAREDARAIIKFMQNMDFDCIAVDRGEYWGLSSDKEYPDYLINLDFTDCGNNEELFKAIAALRDDSDYMQWFVCDSSYIVNNDDYPIYINESHIKGEWFLCKNDNFGGDYSENWHKASVKELIEHFK